MSRRETAPVGPNKSTSGSQTARNDINTTEVAVTILVNVMQVGLACVGSYYISRWLSKNLQGQNAVRPYDREARSRLERMLIQRAVTEGGDEDDEDEEAIKIRVKRKLVTTLDLNDYENSMAEDVIDPSEISTTFRDVGGIDGIKAELFDLVVLPILRPDLFQSISGLVTPPKGILLYGAPGTGKTMLAKAIAKESGASFVNVRLSKIMDKYFGESNKLIAAVFSLAIKVAPSVIFIDEIDTFLNQRDSQEGSPTSSIKSEFLIHWDGVLTDDISKKHSASFTVLGATNRPFDVDSAILRRLPRTFEIGLPNFKSRLQILNLFLEKQSMTESARAMIPAIAKSTNGYSGSDLKELCRAAAMEPIREMTRKSSQKAVMAMEAKDEEHSPTTTALKSDLSLKQRNKISKMQKQGKLKKKKVFGPPRGHKVRAVDEKDFAEALKKVKRTGETAHTFRRSESEALNSVDGSGLHGLAEQMKMLQTLISGTNSIGEDRNSTEDSDVPNII